MAVREATKRTAEGGSCEVWERCGNVDTKIFLPFTLFLWFPLRHIFLSSFLCVLAGPFNIYL